MLRLNSVRGLNKNCQLTAVWDEATQRPKDTWSAFSGLRRAVAREGLTGAAKASACGLAYCDIPSGVFPRPRWQQAQRLLLWRRIIACRRGAAASALRFRRRGFKRLILLLLAGGNPPWG